MLYFLNIPITDIRYGNNKISYIYYMNYLVWQAIHSCFANGYWLNDVLWSNKDGWKNDK